MGCRQLLKRILQTPLSTSPLDAMYGYSLGNNIKSVDSSNGHIDRYLHVKHGRMLDTQTR